MDDDIGESSAPNQGAVASPTDSDMEYNELSIQRQRRRNKHHLKFALKTWSHYGHMEKKLEDTISVVAKLSAANLRLQADHMEQSETIRQQSATIKQLSDRIRTLELQHPRVETVNRATAQQGIPSAEIGTGTMVTACRT
jgi:hypothetical protein